MSVLTNHEAILKSAGGRVAALSPAFNRVGVYLLRGGVFEVDPFILEPTADPRVPCGRRDI